MTKKIKYPDLYSGGIKLFPSVYGTNCKSRPYRAKSKYKGQTVSIGNYATPKEAYDALLVWREKNPAPVRRSSRFIGVTYTKNRQSPKKWRADAYLPRSRKNVKRKNVFVGYYLTEREAYQAIIAYKEKVLLE